MADSSPHLPSCSPPRLSFLLNRGGPSAGRHLTTTCHTYPPAAHLRGIAIRSALLAAKRADTPIRRAAQNRIAERETGRGGGAGDGAEPDCGYHVFPNMRAVARPGSMLYWRRWRRPNPIRGPIIGIYASRPACRRARRLDRHETISPRFSTRGTGRYSRSGDTD